MRDLFAYMMWERPMQKFQQNGQKKDELKIFCQKYLCLVNCIVNSTGVDNDGIDDDEENVGKEDEVERHAVHLLFPSEEPVHLGILFRLVGDSLLHLGSESVRHSHN